MVLPFVVFVLLLGSISVRALSVSLPTTTFWIETNDRVSSDWFGVSPIVILAFLCLASGLSTLSHGVDAARLIWQPFNNIILGLAVQVGRYPGILLEWWQLVIAYSILPMFGAQYSRLKDVSERVSFMLIQSREPHLLCDLLRILIPCRIQTPGGSVHQEMDTYMQSACVVVIGRHSLKHMESSVDFFSLFPQQILVKIHFVFIFFIFFGVVRFL